MQGDLEALKPMVSPAVLEAFRRATAPVAKAFHEGTLWLSNRDVHGSGECCTRHARRKTRDASFAKHVFAAGCMAMIFLLQPAGVMAIVHAYLHLRFATRITSIRLAHAMRQ